ncbi:MAG: sulfurtransferase [Acidimicrobiales bacterium]|nr:sulfurtransferase [Acidimicrobiales bacterium]
MPPFVSVNWLVDHLADVVVCDVRMVADPADAFTEYSAHHLPGAVLVDLNADLAAPAEAILGRHPLPNPEHFAAVLARLGIGSRSRVVAYDNTAGALASRFVWMLRAIGQDAAVLGGGSDAWPGPFESGPVHVEAVGRAPVDWPDELLATSADVEAALKSGVPVIDSRSGERFRGEVEPLDAIAGHIPGAVNLPFSDHLQGGVLVNDPEIRARFADAGIDGSTENVPPIMYCGSGVTACLNILAAESAGLGPARLYVGSWSGWSTTPGAPIATGE